MTRERNLVDKLLENEEVNREVERFINNLKVFNDVMESIKPLVETGAMETLVGLGYLGETLKAILSEEMISSFSKLGTDALELIALTRKENIQRILSALADHQMEFEEEVKKTKVTGLLSLMKILRDEDVRRGLEVLIAYLKILGRYAYPEDKK